MGFEVLTVQEIIDRANVGGATFSAPFDNKNDLLVSEFDDLRTLLKAGRDIPPIDFPNVLPET